MGVLSTLNFFAIFDETTMVPRPFPTSSEPQRGRKRPSTTQEMRKVIKDLIRELKKACQRPLFEEIVGSRPRRALGEEECVAFNHGKRVDSTGPHPKRPKHSIGSKSTNRAWEDLLAEAAAHVPFMTDQEYAMVTRIAAILFLGFLVPTSTGHDFFVMQSQTRRRRLDHQKPGSEESTELELFLGMSLEDRLEFSSRLYNSEEFGEMNCCLDPNRERAFRSFLHNGLAPLLAARPSHPTETDLLHLIAMVISPQPEPNLINCQALDERDSPSWSRTKRLMACLHSHSFQVCYSHRRDLVKIAAERLVLPEVDKRSHSGSSDPIMDGAVPHLRSALHDFSIGAQSRQDSHLARSALVNVVVRTGHELTVNEEWDSLVTLSTRNFASCKCGGRNISESKRSTDSLFSDSFCESSARGNLMESFILRYNESRHYADAVFISRAMVALSEFVDSQVRVLIASLDPDGSSNAAAAPECLLVSHLLVASSLFYFILPYPNDDSRDASISQGDEDGPLHVKHATDKLLRNAIQLLDCPRAPVAKAASSLLALAFAYNPKLLSLTLCRTLCKSIQMSWDRLFQNETVKGSVNTSDLCYRENVITTTSRISSAFAFSMLDYLLKKLNQFSGVARKEKTAFLVTGCHHVAAIASARPLAAQKHCASILSLSKMPLDEVCTGYVVAAILSLRLSHFFVKDIADDTADDTAATVDQLLRSISDRWTKYRLGRHALVTGNYYAAARLFQSCISSCSSEASFLWLSVLSQVASAESELASMGSRGILLATPLLQSSLSYMQSLASMSGNSIVASHEFVFQIEYLQLRIDFLDVCAAVRSLCREIRLSNAIPKRNVRTGLHLRNALKLFLTLANRYFSLYRRSGLFLCQQSRTALRTCHAVCRWIGEAGRKAFPECSPNKSEPAGNTIWPHGDQLHPLSSIRRKLNGLVLDRLDSSLEPQLRAAAISEALDAVIMTPYPFPRGFATVKSPPKASVLLSLDPSSIETDASTEDATSDAQDDEGVIDLYPGMTCAIVATGTVPENMNRMANLSFSHVLLSYSLRYAGALEDETLAEETVTRSISDPPLPCVGYGQPSKSPLLASGRFLVPVHCQAPLEEGLYSVEMKLGCRDARGGEWELPIEREAPMLLRVSRSRAEL